jgi:hypothetical protein
LTRGGKAGGRAGLIKRATAALIISEMDCDWITLAQIYISLYSPIELVDSFIEIWTISSAIGSLNGLLTSFVNDGQLRYVAVSDGQRRTAEFRKLQ